jgi:hypothetical protein
MCTILYWVVIGFTGWAALALLELLFSGLCHAIRNNPAHAIALAGFLTYALLAAMMPQQQPPQQTYQQQQQPIMPFSQRWAFTERHQ